MNPINPLLTDYAQMKHRELNGETHPPHYLEIARIEASMSPADVPQRTRSAGIGINLGRNVWKHEHPVAMAKALRAIIHENADVEGAQEIFNETRDRHET